jgi:phage-related protein
MYRVDFYTTQSGKSPPFDFIQKSEARVARKILRHIQHIKTYGLTLENRYLRKLTGSNLWESRILGNDSIRIICAVLAERRVVILNIFTKKSNKTPVKELDVANQRFRELTTIS